LLVMELNENKLNENEIEGGEQKNDELAKLYESSIKEVKAGQIVRGKVLDIKNGYVLIDIGYKSEGLIPLNEFQDATKLNVGDEIDVLLESLEDEDGMVVLSKKKAERTKGWETIMTRYHKRDRHKEGQGRFYSRRRHRGVSARQPVHDEGFLEYGQAIKPDG